MANGRSGEEGAAKYNTYPLLQRYLPVLSPVEDETWGKLDAWTAGMN